MRKQVHGLCAALVFSVAVSAMAQEYTSRMEVLQNEELRQDFLVQGEYLADVEGLKVGLHLIADGGGKFRIVGYFGGLPGDAWKAGAPRVLGTAALNGDEIIFNATEQRNPASGIDMAVGEVRGKVTIETPQRGQGGGQGGGAFRGTPVRIALPASGDRPAIVFEKQTRRSPTLGAEAPEGAVVVFDGTNLDKFRDGARMNEPQRGGNTLWAEAATTAFEKKPYKMHLEFMLSYMPQARGQQRSNSGVYIDERYELQILDSFGLEGRNDECGGFYQVAAPLVNMCFPPLTWQTYDLEFTPARWDGDNKVANARVTVKHNGVLIHDDIEFQQHTPGRAQEGPGPLGVYLQGHGNKVQYRNIWLQYQDWAEPTPVQAEAPVAEAPVVEEPTAEAPVAEEAESNRRFRRAADQPAPQPLFPRLRGGRR